MRLSPEAPLTPLANGVGDFAHGLGRRIGVGYGIRRREAKTNRALALSSKRFMHKRGTMSAARTQMS